MPSLVSSLLVLWGVWLHAVTASIYPVTSSYWVPPFQRAEKLFATDQGPILARTGNSSVTIDISGVNVTQDMAGWSLVVFFYHVDNYEDFEAVAGKIELLACSDVEGMKFDGMSDVQRFVFTVANESTPTVSANVSHLVNSSGWTDTQIFVCAEDEGAATETLTFSGSMEVRNPYGLLPAVLYGMLPFSGFLTVGYLVLDVFFVFLLIRHRRQLLSLHWGILLILVMGTAASAVWLYAFYRMNKTGEPVCCPYPTTFLIAVILDTFVRTLARVILLIVCLGYGIVRSHLSRVEASVIAFLSLAYFVSGIADEVTRGTSSGADFREKPTAWSFIQLLCNLAFIMWIQYSMERILRDLRDQKQFAKLSMYRWLAWSLAAFIVFFTILTIVAVCSRLGVFEWDVEWEWMQLVAWPVLNFTVSAAMTLIWRPTQNSSQFAYSMQLPMIESPGIEMTRNTHGSSSDEDINPEIESDSDAEKPSHHEKKQKSYSKDSDDMEGV
ncbi:Gpr7 transmembrane protein [Phytophthora infestans T30-4]|uniref:Gpr7 transmembrane protein n=1 Tax=Phytophthora infestans (strain T30-4) TaxID=403677 RepID=D0N823_PHYIT|nr:Gpr7 transmembrane protein [Phytophthora infestans T30-4]EEY53140.1 Gpr7 transmembrane protein [Phytophthora infestans T30-4]|eukprot:XP_002904758.1 Gpr7 transmembrane protein [Phytophthora infestans T30-4]